MSAVSPFSLALARPLATATGTIDRRQGFLVRLGEGPAGLGEASPLAGWTETLDECRDALHAATGGDDPTSADALAAMPATPAARHGLELALLDRAARVAGVPLYRHLGGEARVSAVPVNATVGDADLESTVEAARAAVDRGFRAVKLKVGARAVDVDLERVAAVRAAVGSGVELRVDANGAWTPEQAETAIDSLAEQAVSLVEQPLEAAALAAHADLRGRGVDIALDESLRANPADAVLDAGAADVLVLKPMALGGVGRCRALADEAAQRDVDVVVTTTVDAAVARTAAVHLAAALGVDRACGLATADRLAEDVAEDPAPVVDGAISVPQSAGNGVGVEDLD